VSKSKFTSAAACLFAFTALRHISIRVGCCCVAAAATAAQDVEGFELQVLEGSESLLAKYHVNYVVAEYTFGGEPRQRKMLK
jgi:hypothetical protein